MSFHFGLQIKTLMHELSHQDNLHAFKTSKKKVNSREMEAPHVDNVPKQTFVF